MSICIYKLKYFLLCLAIKKYNDKNLKAYFTVIEVIKRGDKKRELSDKMKEFAKVSPKYLYIDVCFKNIWLIIEAYEHLQ